MDTPSSDIHRILCDALFIYKTNDKKKEVIPRYIHNTQTHIYGVIDKLRCVVKVYKISILY